MSRRESDREDLLREATALVQRAELRIPASGAPIIAGFRRDGSASFYFGADPVYQFNTARELRRAYVDGLLYKAERGRLVSLTRQRGESAITLLCTELRPPEAAALIEQLQDRLAGVRQALQNSSFVLIGQVPVNANIVRQIQDWLAGLPQRIVIASVPHAR